MGLRYTMRFSWRKEGPLLDRSHFGRGVLIGLLQVKASETLGMVTNTLDVTYDLTFMESRRFREVLKV